MQFIFQKTQLAIRMLIVAVLVVTKFVFAANKVAPEALSKSDFAQSLLLEPQKKASVEGEGELKIIGQDYMLASGGIDAGGGGGIKRIKSKAFPDLKRLRSVVLLASEFILDSSLPPSAKEGLVTELKHLYEEDKFRMLPVIIVIQPSSPVKPMLMSGKGAYLSGHSLRLENGEITFSEEILKDSDAEIAELLIHEVLHQVLSYGLSIDEEFIIPLAREISQKNVSGLSLEIIGRGHYFRPGHFYLSQYLEALEKTIKALLTCGYKESESAKNFREVQYGFLYEAALSKLGTKYGYEISKAPYLDLQQDVKNLIYEYGAKGCLGNASLISLEGEVTKLRRLYNSNPKYPAKNTTFGYRKDPPLFDLCKKGQAVNGKWICARELLKLQMSEYFFESSE